MTNDNLIDNKTLIHKLYKEVLADWNMAMVDALLAADFISHDWPKGTPAGPQTFKGFYAKIKAALPDARYELDDVIAEGEKVVTRWRLLGTHDGPFDGMAPTGRSIVLNGIAIYRVSNGKVQERWVVTDLHALLQQAPGAVQ
ncbi:ester cyclase [Chitinophaga sp. NPDC101104]|uniref:ester cyclase n=1 Tax=Chitinophaga sp. NPDC101104 TaxID=3390561 RepID=UPI003CFDD809